VPIFITKLLRGESPVIYGDGEQSRDFTYIANAVGANLLAAAAPGAPGGVFNVACGTRFSLNELVRKLQRLTHSAVPPTYAPARPGDVLHSQGDIESAARMLGYRPKVTFDEGLAATVQWFCKTSQQ
jgi:nucleoside-diphosphate-sugar epimerase